MLFGPEERRTSPHLRSSEPKNAEPSPSSFFGTEERRTPPPSLFEAKNDNGSKITIGPAVGE